MGVASSRVYGACLLLLGSLNLANFLVCAVANGDYGVHVFIILKVVYVFHVVDFDQGVYLGLSVVHDVLVLVHVLEWVELLYLLADKVLLGDYWLVLQLLRPALPCGLSGPLHLSQSRYRFLRVCLLDHRPVNLE